MGWRIPLGGFLCSLMVGLQAQVPTILTDKVYKGDGIIDLMKDVSASQLQDYVDTNGRFLLGVDLNEDASGNESSTSVGVAIKQIELLISTSDGDFTFRDFYTSTTAMIQEAGTGTAQEFYTLFGQSGSSQISSATSGFDLSTFDDVISIDNISFSGTIQSAELRVTFLNTAKTGQNSNEAFFDYSAGFEDFALLDAADAALLEAANVGLADAPTGITYTLDPTPSTLLATETTSPPTSGPPAPGAPAPPLIVLALFGVLLIARAKGSAHG